MKRLIIGFTITTGAVGFVLANDTSVWEYPDGSGVIPMAEDNIQMVAETVRVKVKKGTRMEVEARFTFKNLSDKTVNVTMGFPFNENWGEMFWEEEGTGRQNARDSLRFVSLVDGKEVKVRIREDATENEGNPSWNRRFFFVWDTEFAPGQTRKLTTRYETDWDRWHNVDDQFSYTFTYITTTGAAWAGKIGEAVISVEVPKKLPRPVWSDERVVYWKPIPSEPAISHDSSRLVWSFKDWEPERDISITISGQGYRQYRYMMVEGIHEIELQDPVTEDEVRDILYGFWVPRGLAVRVFVNTLYAMAGHRFKDKDWDALFRDLVWYKPKKALELKDLPDNYQRAIGYAMKFEAEQKAMEERVKNGPYGRFMSEFAVMFFFPPYWNFRQEDISRYLPPDTAGQRAWLRLARNAFYARAGYQFEDKDLAEFFMVMPWYNPGVGFEGLGPDEAEAVLNIIKLEEKMGFR